MDDVARAIEVAGIGAMLAKVDIKSAYCMISIDPEYRPLLGMVLTGALYVHGLNTVI